MTHIHYKFSSKLSYATVVFDGPQVTLTDLKEKIMGREKLRAGDCDLQITNAQTKEAYTDEEGLIPKGSSVIVRRVPNTRGSVKKNQNVERLYHASGAIKTRDVHSSSKTLPLFSKMVNLAAADVSEDDKIKVVMNQSSYDPMTYNKKNGGVLHANNTCYRCGNVGHQVRNCPSGGDKNFDIVPKIKKSTGIPRSFMVEVDDPNIKGAMLTSCGRYAIPTIDAQAYAIGKKEKHPFLHQEESKPEDEKVPVPKDFQCLICRDLLVDSVVIPCCGNSYCDDCIRTALLDSEDHVCPTCNQSDVSPDTLIANKSLRQAVNNFEKEKGYTRSLKENSVTPQSLTTKPAPGPTPLTLQQEKNLQSTVSQQADGNESQAHCPVSLSPYIQAGEKTKDLAADTPEIFLHKDTTAGLSHPTTLVNNDPALKSSIGRLTPTNLPSSSSYSLRPTGVVGKQQQPLPPSSSCHPSVPPPLFLSHQFHLFPPGQKFHNHPSGQMVHPPNSTHPNPHVTSILPVVPTSSSSSSIRPLIQRDWLDRHRQGKERSPRPRSTYRHTSHSKSQTSRSSSRSSRSRSRSNSRSRPSSPYSRHRIQHPRTNPSRSYGCGYKRSRSPTASSSSSPRESSRSTSHSEHRKKRPNKKSSHSGYNSNRRAEKSPTSPRAEGHSGKSDAKQPTSSQDLNSDYYEQWKRQYKEWYDKYFASYVSHYHQMPPPLHSLPPPPNLLWADQGDDPSNHKLPSHSTHRRSPPSQSSKDSRSSRSPSSNESRSPLSRSWSDCNSPQSRSHSDTSSPPSKNATPHWGHTEKDTSLRQEYKQYEKVVPEDHSSSTGAAHLKGKKDKRLHSEVSVEKPIKSNKIVSEKHQRPESENKHLKTKASYPRQQDDKCQNVKHTQKSQKVHKDVDREFYKDDRKGKDVSDEKNQESPIKSLESSGYMKINLDTADGKFPHNPNKEQQEKPEKKPQPHMENMWKEKSKLKPRKICININLDQKRPEDKIEKKITSCSKRSNVKENYEKLEVQLPGLDNKKSNELSELPGSDKVHRPTQKTVEGLRPREETAEGLRPREETPEELRLRVDPVEELGPREETSEGLRPREETSEGLRPREETSEGLRPREETSEGLRPREETSEGLRPREETSEGLRPREETSEGLRPREETSEGLRPREETSEGLRPREETSEGLRPREETSEGLRPREETPEGLRPREETPEGLRSRVELGLREETPEGLRPREETPEGLSSRVDPAEEPGPRVDPAEEPGPRVDPAEEPGPRVDPAEEPGPRVDPAEEPGPRVDPAEEPGPRVDPAEEPGPRVDPAEEPGPRVDPAEEPGPRVDPAEEPGPREETPEGLRSRVDPAEELGPREETPEGLRSRVDLAEELGPREGTPEWLRSRVDPAEELGLREEMPEGLRSRVDLAEELGSREGTPEWLRPREETAEALGPREETAEALGPREDPAEALGPREDPAEALGPREDPAEALGPREDPAEALGPRVDPAEELGSIEETPEGLRSRVDLAEELRSRLDPAEELGPREETPEGLRPREETPEGLRPREETPEGLWPREETPEGLWPREETPEGLWPREETPEWLRPRVVPAEELGPREETPEGLRSRVDPAEELRPREDPAEALGPRVDPAEELGPIEETPEGLRSREETPEGLRPREETPEGLWPREETPEGLRPRDETPEGPRPREETPEGLRPREETPEGLWPREETPEGLRPREETPEGLRPREETPEGLWPREETPEGLWPREETPEGLWPREETPEGLWPREETPEGLRPREETPEWLRPRVVPAEELGPREETPEGLRSKVDPAEELRPREDPAEALGPREDPAEALGPREDPAEALGPREDPAEALGPREDPAEALGPREDPAEALGPREDPAEALGPREDPAEALGPREDPAEALGPTEDPAEGLATTEDPAEGLGPREDPTEGVMFKQALSSKETMMDGVKMKNMSDESAHFIMPHSSHKPNITVESDCSFNLASSRTFILDWIEGEDSLERRIEVTNSLLGQKHNQDDAFEPMQAPLCKFDNEDPEDDKQQVSVAHLLPPVTQGSWKPQGEEKNKRQMSDENTNEERCERNASLTPSSGRNEGSTAGERKDGKKRCKREEEQKKESFESPPKHLFCSSLTVHQPDRQDNEPEVSIGASDDRESIASNKRKKQHHVPLDVKSESAKYDYCHVKHDSKESKHNTNVSLPSITHPSKRLRTLAECSGSKPGSKPKRQHDGRSTLKPKPESREEMWKKYKLEKLLKESQQLQAAKQPDPEKGVDCCHEGKIHQAEGEKPSDHNGNVKTEHEPRSIKHETEKRHGVTDQDEFEVQEET